MEGPLSDLPRKNCWTIAEYVEGATPDGMWHLWSPRDEKTSCLRVATSPSRCVAACAVKGGSSGSNGPTYSLLKLAGRCLGTILILLEGDGLFVLFESCSSFGRWLDAR